MSNVDIRSRVGYRSDGDDGRRSRSRSRSPVEGAARTRENNIRRDNRHNTRFNIRRIIDKGFFALQNDTEIEQFEQFIQECERDYEIPEYYREIYKNYGKWERIVHWANVLHFHQSGETSTGTYISRVISFTSEAELNKCCETLQRELQNWKKTHKNLERAMYIISKHDMHIHVIHDCTYNSSGCRCPWWKKETSSNKHAIILQAVRRGRGREKIQRISIQQWHCIFFYFSTRGHYIQATSLRSRMQSTLQGKAYYLLIYYILHVVIFLL